ncbi:DUF397 domain-containing protein [Streptomyces sp. NPDC056309]|uniref:DUF397 domain-containing protein n=1 Tax=unclassified Streptomyces TaxID=2593676 RepID=UPI0035E3A7D6
MTTSAEVPCFRSSYSGGSGTECVEAAFLPSGVLVRDSKWSEHPHLTASAKAWVSFVAGTHHARLSCGAPFRHLEGQVPRTWPSQRLDTRVKCRIRASALT